MASQQVLYTCSERGSLKICSKSFYLHNHLLEQEILSEQVLLKVLSQVQQFGAGFRQPNKQLDLDVSLCTQCALKNLCILH